VSRAFYDPKRGRIFAAFNYPGVVAHIGAIGVEDGRIEKLSDIKGPVIYTVTSLAYDPGAGALFYTTDNGALRDVMRLDVATHKTEMLLEDARIGDLAFNPADRSLWGVRHLNGICTLVRIPPPYREWHQVVSWPYGTVMYDLDVSRDGRQLVASFGEISGQQEVRVFTLESLARKDTTPIATFDFGSAVPNNFVFAPDGRSVFGSSYFTGVSNIYQYDLERKKLDAVSNTDTGLFRPVPTDEGNLIVFRYSGEGFVPAWIQPRPLEDVGAITFLGERLIAEHPVLKDWMVGSPARVPLDTMPQQTGEYRLAGGLRRESFYPVLQGYKNVAAVGMRFNFSDPLQLNRVSTTLSYSPAGELPSSERLHLKAEYQRYDWRGAFHWNGADFYDVFGPTKTSRKGYLLGVGRKTTLIFDEPRRLDLDIDGRYTAGLDTLPEYQNIHVNIDRLLSVEARLSYTDIRNSLGNVDDETGHRWALGAEGQYSEGTFPRFYGTYDRGTPLPAGHSSVWFRGAAGFSPRSVEEPLSNFFFGGFGNNWVDHRDEKRYRALESFPGVELNEIAGRNFLKGTFELNLPPWRFRHAGIPSFHATWARPAIFLGGLVTNVDAPDLRRVATNVGAQLDFRFGLLSALDMTISTGVAVAFENGRRPKREAMLSLKILR
jgi:hypothetical protein